MSFISDLANFVAAKTYDDFSKEAVELSKEHIFDTISVGLAGLNSKPADIMRNYARTMGGNEISSLFGGGKINPQTAALVNGTICHVHDYDDDSLATVSHPSPVIVPALLAVGESIGASGKDVISAFILGVEVLSQISSVVNLSHYLKGWHVTSSLGMFAATAGCGKLLNLNEEQMTNAMAIAASCPSGLKTNFGTMTKPFHAGYAAQCGVMTAFMARDGFEANPMALEDPNAYGFFGVCCGFNECNFDNNREMGNPYEIESPGINFKYYPCCSAVHALLDCVIEMAQTHDIDYRNVDKVDIIMSKMFFDILHYQLPKTELEAKFSAEFAAATALVNRSCELKHFSDKMIQAPEIVQLIKKMTRMHRAPIEGEAWPADAGAVITLKDGTMLEHFVDGYIGHHLIKPFQREHHLNKLKSCYEYTFGPGNPEKYVEAFLDRFETVEDIGSVMALIRNAKE